MIYIKNIKKYEMFKLLDLLKMLNNKILKNKEIRKKLKENENYLYNNELHYKDNEKNFNVNDLKIYNFYKFLLKYLNNENDLIYYRNENFIKINEYLINIKDLNKIEKYILNEL